MHYIDKSYDNTKYLLTHNEMFSVKKYTMNMIFKITKQEYENCTFQIVQILCVVTAILLYMYISKSIGIFIQNPAHKRGVC